MAPTRSIRKPLVERIPIIGKRATARRESQERERQVKLDFVQRKLDNIGESMRLLSGQAESNAKQLSMYNEGLERIRNKVTLKPEFLRYAFGDEEYARYIKAAAPVLEKMESPCQRKMTCRRLLTAFVHSKPPEWHDELAKRTAKLMTRHAEAKKDFEAQMAAKQKLLEAALKERERLR